VHNHIRGLSPHPGAWFELPVGTRVRARRSTRADGGGAPGTVLNVNLTIACGDGTLRLVEVQRAGKQPMTADDFLRGTAVPKGTRLS
jgi:methionyl-tRNA formyltransferase